MGVPLLHNVARPVIAHFNAKSGAGEDIVIANWGKPVARLVGSADAVVAISPLVTLEFLVGPLREENLVLHDHYVRVFKQFRLLPLEPEHYVRAVELCARHGIRTSEALHLAAAQLHGCDQLWTNDNRIAAAASGLNVVVMGRA